MSHLSKDIEQPRKAGRASRLAEGKGKGVKSYVIKGTGDWTG